MLWFVLFVLWPLAELFVIVKVSEWLGFLWMLLLLVISWPVGTRLLRAQGRVALGRLGDAVTQGRTPAREVVDGALVLFGGLLLIVPGFITDAIGLLLLVPPIRSLAGRRLARHLDDGPLRRMVDFGARRSGGGTRRGAAQDYDVDSTAFDIDERQLRP